MNYEYGHLSVPGGGFVTGFIFHPKTPNILYCRTDIGGVYRYDYDQECWKSLVDQVTDLEMYKTYPLAIALDPAHENRLYMAVGDRSQSAIGISEDFGQSFEYLPTPIVDGTGKRAWIHGNAPGRSTGERLMVDPFNSDILYLGTMEDGLFRTIDRCRTWQKILVGHEKNISFIEIDSRFGNEKEGASRLIVGTSGQGGLSKDGVRGPSVFISHDGGASFDVLSDKPQPVIGGGKDFPGYVGQRALILEDYLYITYAAYNIGWSNLNSYGCDTGLAYDGGLFRYKLDENGQVLEALDLTPKHPLHGLYRDSLNPHRRLGYGMSGISADAKNPGVLICSTITSGPDVAYRSTDYGLTWKPILAGLEIGQLDFTTSYQRPEFNGNASLIHWMSDFKINPFNSDMALFNTGAGVFMTHNLTAADDGEDVVFRTENLGIEETVHLNVYSFPDGDNHVLDIIGDYGGFIFKDIDTPAENTFADEEGNRWITCMNGDFPDRNPNTIVVTARGNWTGKTKGGLIISKDQGKSWKKVQDPTSINPEMDEAIEMLKKPNVTSGWVAIDAGDKDLVWAIGLPLKGQLVIASQDMGESWQQVRFKDLTNLTLDVTDVPIKIFSDRNVADRFFGFGDFLEGTRVFCSENGGISFHEISLDQPLPKQLVAGIDSEQDVEIRGVSARDGEFLFAFNEEGLYHLIYNDQTRSFKVDKLSKDGDTIKRIGIGKNAPGSSQPTLFTSGLIGGIYGFYRSEDFGHEWIRINDDQTHFGDIRSISGDPRVYGRVYVATGTRGLVYGEMKTL